MVLRATVLLAFASAAAASCGAPSDGAAPIQVTETDSAGVPITTISGAVEDLPTWLLASTPTFEISGNAPPYLGSIGEVAFLSDTSLLVEDNQTRELRLFQPTGDARLVGGRGEGPGEFQNLTKLTATAGDSFYVFDRRLGRLSAYDERATLVSTMALSREEGGPETMPMDAWALDSDHVVLHRLGPHDSVTSTSVPRRDQRDAVLSVRDRGGSPRGPVVRFRGGYTVESAAGDGVAPFANRPAVSVASGHLAYTSGIDYEVTVTDRDLQPVRIVRWPGWREPLSAVVVQAARDTVNFALREMRAVQPELADQLLEMTFSPGVLPDTLPAVGSVLLSPSGELWVSRFLPTTQLWDQASAWHVLSPLGHPEARVPLPTNARLVAVRGSLIALIVRDSLAVEHLRVFAVLRH